MGLPVTQLFSFFIAVASLVACNVTTTSETTTSTDDQELNGNSNRQMNGQNSSGDGRGTGEKQTSTKGGDGQENSPVDITGMYLACTSVANLGSSFKTSCRFNRSDNTIFKGGIEKIEDVKIIKDNTTYDPENLVVDLKNYYERFSFNSPFKEPELSLLAYLASDSGSPITIDSSVYASGSKYYMFSMQMGSAPIESPESIRVMCEQHLTTDSPFDVPQGEANPIIPPFGTLNAQLGGRTFYNTNKEVLASFPQGLLLEPAHMELAGHIYDIQGYMPPDRHDQYAITGFEPNGEPSTDDCSGWNTLNSSGSHMGRAGNIAGTGTWYSNDGTTEHSSGEIYDLVADCSLNAWFICIVPIVD